MHWYYFGYFSNKCQNYSSRIYRKTQNVRNQTPEWKQASQSARHWFVNSILNLFVQNDHWNNRWKYFFKKPIKSLINGDDKTDVQMREYILGRPIFVNDLLVTLLLRNFRHHQYADVSKKLYLHKFGITSHIHFLIEQVGTCIK